MPQKTKRARKDRHISNSHVSRRRRRTRQLPVKSDMNSEKDKEPLNENHHYYSKMLFDRNTNTLSTESQKDGGPIKRRKCTLEELKQDIPIAAELIIDHLDRKVPRSIQYPLPNGIEFKSVLPNPADLGLIPPKLSMNHTKKHRKFRNHHHRFDGENLRLMVEDDDEHDDRINRQRRKRPRDLFGLP